MEYEYAQPTELDKQPSQVTPPAPSPNRSHVPVYEDIQELHDVTTAGSTHPRLGDTEYQYTQCPAYVVTKQTPECSD